VDDAATPFDNFWSIWPRNQGRYSRKGGKSACLKVWLKRYHDTQADTILKHVAWLKTTADWLKDGGAFIPAPLVYLNQQRWDGADIPEPVESKAIESSRKWIEEHSAPIPVQDEASKEATRKRLAEARQSVLKRVA